MDHLGKRVIEAQALKVRELVSSVLQPGQAYAVLDFPNYANVGDSAIWVGLVKALRERSGLRPSYVNHSRPGNLDELADALPDGPIFICGGGNFGDIWDDHQLLRYALMERFPGRPIIQMPQSIHFRADENIERCRNAITKHGAFHMAVRDAASYAFATKHFDCPVTLAPDTAFCIGPLEKQEFAMTQHETLFMLRTDVERSGIDIREVTHTVDGPVWDWLDEPASTTRKSPLTVVETIKSGAISKQSLKEKHFEAVANRRLERGLTMLAQGGRIVTDRLHVHILSVLLNIPHVALDNSYGKIHGYMDAWTKDCPLVSRASSAAEAFEALSRSAFWFEGEWRRANEGIGYSRVS